MNVPVTFKLVCRMIEWLPIGASLASVGIRVWRSFGFLILHIFSSRTWGPLLSSCSSLRSSSPRSSAPPPADRGASPAGRMSPAASGRGSWRKCSCGRPRLETAPPRSSWTTWSWGCSKGGARSFFSFQRVRRRRRRRWGGRRGRCWSAARSRRCPSTWPSTCWGTWCRWRRWRTRWSRSKSTAKSWTRSGSESGILRSTVGARPLYFSVSEIPLPKTPNCTFGNIKLIKRKRNSLQSISEFTQLHFLDYLHIFVIVIFVTIEILICVWKCCSSTSSRDIMWI